MEINGFEIENYNVYGIKDKAKSSICPSCSHTRKKKTDKCMSVFWDTGLGQCNHCGETIQLHTYKKKLKEITYVLPIVQNTSLSYTEDFINYSSSRSISKQALKRLKVSQGRDWMPKAKKEIETIRFNYYLNNELINIKYRGKNKDFKLYKDAEKIFYNLDSIRTSNNCVIVEGEWDVLSYVESGINNVVSVPNGFNLKGDQINLEYLDGYIEYFENKTEIYIAVDNDEAGLKGQKELVRRLGAEVCKIVDFKDCKDANDYLLKYGKDELRNTLKNAKDVKIEGIHFAEDVRDSLYSSYRNGQKRGTTTYVDIIDNAWTWRGGEVNIWTGYQNEGKSLMLNQLCVIRAYFEDAKVAVFSPENMPIDDFYNDIIEMFIGQSVDPYYENNYMNENDFEEGLKFANKNFFLIYPEKNFKLDTIFERAKYLVKKQGVRTLIIDPYNTVEHKIKSGEREDLYISRFMAQLKRFSVQYDLSINLVAHQLTARINQSDGGRYYKPSLNNIKGGGTFADKADNVLYVWRPDRAIDFKSSSVVLGSQKIKKQKLVGIPQDIDSINFNIRTNRYLFNGDSPFKKIDRQRGKIPKDIPMPVLTPEEAFKIK